MQENGTTEVSERRSLRALKAGCRVTLLSKLDKAAAAAMLAALEELACAREDVVIAPEAWIGENRDTLLLLSDGHLVAAVVLHKVAVCDPLIVGPAASAAVALDLLWPHLAGFLTGQGFDTYYFGVPDSLSDYQAVLERDGFAENASKDRTFYRKRLTPELL